MIKFIPGELYQFQSLPEIGIQFNILAGSGEGPRLLHHFNMKNQMMPILFIEYIEIPQIKSGIPVFLYDGKRIIFNYKYDSQLIKVT
jgi:hypothetical protein